MTMNFYISQSSCWYFYGQVFTSLNVAQGRKEGFEGSWFKRKVPREVCWVLSQAQRLKACFFPARVVILFIPFPCLCNSSLFVPLSLFLSISPFHHLCCLVSPSLWAEANLRRILAWLEKKRFILAWVQLKEALHYWSRTSLLQCDIEKK